MALSGSVSTATYTTSGGRTYKVVLSWTATQDYAANTSKISWTAKVSASAGYIVVSELRITIAGKQAFYRDTTHHTEGYNNTLLASGSMVLTHNDDGSKKFSAKVEAGIYQYAINKTGQSEFTLNSIPRASTIGATNAEIESNSTIVVTKKTSSYTHSIKYSFGSLSGYITASGGTSSTEKKISETSISFKLPTSFYGQIPNAKTGKCKLTCTTYSGSTVIGSPSTAEFTVGTSATLCAPSISGSVKDKNEVTKSLTEDETKLVKFFSTALCEANAEAKNGATIKKYIIAGIENDSGSVEIKNIEMSSVTFIVEDSRGYRSSQKVTIDLIQYTKLTVNVGAKRDSPTSGEATLSIRGNYFNGFFGTAKNSLAVKYQIAKSGESYGREISLSPTISENNYSVHVSLTGLDYQSNYNVKIVVSDKLITATQVFEISKGVPIADWGETDFKFNVPVFDRDGSEIGLRAIFKAIFPVGSIVIRYDHTNPATLFGGTWERIAGTFLYGVGQSGIIGNTGGGTLGEQLGVTGTDFGGIMDKGNGSYSARIVVTEYGNANTNLSYSNLNKMGVDVMPPYTNVSIWRRTA